jgi:hypothetical protein
MACDLTRVGTMQWADSEAKFILNFAPLNMPDHHHAYQHEKGFQPDALFKIYQWYATNFAYFLAKLDSVQEGDGTLLDNTLIYATTDSAWARIHSLDGIPAFTAGRAGGKVKSGLHIDGGGSTASRIGYTAMKVLGVDAESWGTKSNMTSKVVSEMLA